MTNETKSAKPPTVLLIAIWGIAVAGILFAIVRDIVQGELSFESLLNLLLLVFGVVGTLIVLRHPKHPAGWTFLAMYLVLGLEPIIQAVVAAQIARFGEAADQWPIGLRLVQAYRESINVSIWFALLIFPALYFPNGELPSPRWRPFARIAAALLVLEVLNPQLSAGWFAESENLFSVPLLELLASIVETSLVLATVVAPISLIVRFRRARGVERQQIKWPLFSAMLATFGIGANLLLYIANSIFGFWAVPEESVVVQAGFAFEGASVLTFPFTIGIGILRYRLYDIDLLINRTLVYGTLSALLAGTYFTVVVLAQQVLPADSPLATVLSTLAIVALFTPLRRRIQSTIDKRFYRQRYDAKQALTAFSQNLQDDVDLDGISERLLQAIDETVLPEHVSLWLKRVER